LKLRIRRWLRYSCAWPGQLREGSRLAPLDATTEHRALQLERA